MSITEKDKSEQSLIAEVVDRSVTVLKNAEMILTAGIKNDEDLKAAAAAYGELQRGISHIETTAQPIYKRVYASYKELKEMYDRRMTPYAYAKERLNDLMGQYREQVRLKAEAEQRRRVQEEAKQQAEIERVRREAEAKAAAETARIEAEKAAKLKEALDAEEAGNKAKADALLNEAAAIAPAAPVELPPPPPPPPPAAPIKHEPAQIDGLSFVDNYDVELVNLADVINGIVNKQIPIEAVRFDDVFCRKMAKAYKDRFNWPGIKLVKTSVARGSRARL